MAQNSPKPSRVPPKSLVRTVGAVGRAEPARTRTDVPRDIHRLWMSPPSPGYGVMVGTMSGTPRRVASASRSPSCFCEMRSASTRFS